MATDNTMTRVQEIQKLTDALLKKYLPPASEEPRILHEAMRYSVMAGGKRLRPMLALATFEYCGGLTDGEDLPIHYAMAALEMVHTYSLIHDDLPCMDDDDLRRGMPTCHKKFGEAVAVLAGDALHDIAFELLARTESTSSTLPAYVEAEGREVTREDVVNIHRRKTGALIRCAVRLGAILAGADEQKLTRLTEYGEKTGLAFQIVDDILDIEGDQQLLGKKVGSDDKNQKATYPGAVGLEQARLDAARLLDEAVSVFDSDEENLLTFAAAYIGQRNR